MRLDRVQYNTEFQFLNRQDEYNSDINFVYFVYSILIKVILKY